MLTKRRCIPCCGSWGYCLSIIFTNLRTILPIKTYSFIFYLQPCPFTPSMWGFFLWLYRIYVTSCFLRKNRLGNGSLDSSSCCSCTSHGYTFSSSMHFKEQG